MRTQSPGHPKRDLANEIPFQGNEEARHPRHPSTESSLHSMSEVLWIYPHNGHIICRTEVRSPKQLPLCHSLRSSLYWPWYIQSRANTQLMAVILVIPPFNQILWLTYVFQLPGYNVVSLTYNVKLCRPFWSCLAYSPSFSSCLPDGVSWPSS